MSETDPAVFPEWMRQKRVARDRAENAGNRHLLGNCGYMASLCGDCEHDEKKWMLSVYTAPAAPGETPIQYARRVEMRMLDAWYDVAAQRCAEASRQ